jgi:hypothetical protein
MRSSAPSTSQKAAPWSRFVAFSSAEATEHGLFPASLSIERAPAGGWAGVFRATPAEPLRGAGRRGGQGRPGLRETTARGEARPGARRNHCAGAGRGWARVGGTRRRAVALHRRSGETRHGRQRRCRTDRKLGAGERGAPTSCGGKHRRGRRPSPSPPRGRNAGRLGKTASRHPLAGEPSRGQRKPLRCEAQDRARPQAVRHPPQGAKHTSRATGRHPFTAAGRESAGAGEGDGGRAAGVLGG